MPVLTTEERLNRVIADKYRLDSVLGEGGMGVVYAGHHLGLDLPVAVKFLHPQYSRSPEVVERFLREARATSRLTHPNVIQVRDVDVAKEDGSVFMVLELLTGESLADHLAREKVLSVDAALSYLLPVCDALSAAHAMGIVHRDIKPDNIFLSRGPTGAITTKVLDFGIAKLAEGGQSATATGSVLGTALYMAPEQAMGRTKQIGPASDVWSTAVMLYECLTGAFPFEVDLDAETSPMAVMLASVSAPLVSLETRRPELAGLNAAVMRALSRDVTARTPSMAAFVADLSAVATGLPSATRTQVPLAPTRVHEGGVATGPLAVPDPLVALQQAAVMRRSGAGSDPFAGTVAGVPGAGSPAAGSVGAGSIIEEPRRGQGRAIAWMALLVTLLGAGAGALAWSMVAGGGEVTEPPATIGTPEPSVAPPVTTTAAVAPPVTTTETTPVQAVPSQTAPHLEADTTAVTVEATPEVEEPSRGTRRGTSDRSPESRVPDVRGLGSRSPTTMDSPTAEPVTIASPTTEPVTMDATSMDSTSMDSMDSTTMQAQTGQHRGGGFGSDDF